MVGGGENVEDIYELPKNHIFTMDELIEKLEKAIGKTLGEIDTKHVFDKTVNNPKITGIAGDVVEQSILGYSPDSNQRPDIIVDGVPMEVKTTGIRYSKKKNKLNEYEAKEPMSITAVSPRKIVDEEFDNSHFWKKLANMLLVYYLYASDKPVEAKDYANFYLKSYELHKFSNDDKLILQNDWEIVRDFIQNLHITYNNPEEQYYRLSSELREKLMYIDTAPKWPNPPRFRLKRSVVTEIVQRHFEGRNSSESLPQVYSSYIELDKKCHDITDVYKGKTIQELLKIFNIQVKDINKLDKSISEQIVVRMFGGNSKKINNIELFKKVGLIAKTIVMSSKGGRTEDTKLFAIDFDEFLDKRKSFEESYIYDYFMNHQFLCIMFEEKDDRQEFKNNKFIGFKRLCFKIDFIEEEVKKTWYNLRQIIFGNKLKETIRFNKRGEKRINANGVISTELNFPKSKDYKVFVRGSGIDSKNKPLSLCGINMYYQWIWIKGEYIINLLNKIDYL